MEFHKRIMEPEEREIMALKEEGEVKDLTEKLKRGELTSEEVLEEMKKRGLYHHTGEPIPGTYALCAIVAWCILCFLPYISILLGLKPQEVPLIEIPPVISYLAFFFAIIMVPLLFYSVYLREKRSITGDETIILVRTGAYGIVRHPAGLAAYILFFSLPLILTLVGFSFTILCILGYAALIAIGYLGVRHEEKINIRKWGDEYRQYIKEVPRFNFILGLWKLRKRHK